MAPESRPTVRCPTFRGLHWKLDQLLTDQWQKLLQIQQIQTDLMEALVHKPKRGPAPAAQS